jgi:hypothetical protein
VEREHPACEHPHEEEDMNAVKTSIIARVLIVTMLVAIATTATLAAQTTVLSRVMLLAVSAPPSTW